MEIKATLAAEGDLLSSTAQVDKKKKNTSLAFLCHQKHNTVKPTRGLPDALMPLLSLLSHREPKSDH